MTIDRLLGVMWVDAANERFHWKTPIYLYGEGDEIAREWKRFVSNFTHEPKWVFLQVSAQGEYVPADQVDWWIEATRGTHGNDGE